MIKTARGRNALLLKLSSMALGEDVKLTKKEAEELMSILSMVESVFGMMTYTITGKEPK